jgi:tetratricopeptide (TPR) repeat protein
MRSSEDNQNVPLDLSSRCMAALGWIELGNWQEACTELESLPAALRAHPSAIKTYCRIWAAAERWEELVVIALGASRSYPTHPEFVSHLAAAQMKLARFEESRDGLEKAATRFPEDELIAYQLACCLSVLNRFEEARHWLGKAFEVSKDAKALKLLALDEPRLEPVWTEEQRAGL